MTKQVNKTKKQPTVKPVEVVNEPESFYKEPAPVNLPLYVTLIGTGKGVMKQGKEYPNTHRKIAVNLIEKGVAELKQ